MDNQKKAPIKELGLRSVLIVSTIFSLFLFFFDGRNADIFLKILGCTFLILNIVIVLTYFVRNLQKSRIQKEFPIIPLYEPPQDVSFLEITNIVDGKFGVFDLLSYISHQRINNGTKDNISEIIGNEHNRQSLNKIMTYFLGEGDLNTLTLYMKIYGAINNKLRKHNFINFKPYIGGLISIVITASYFMIFHFLLQFIVIESTESYIFGVKGTLNIEGVVLMVEILGLILMYISIAELFNIFTSNLKNTAKVRSELLGFKMYLQTTEYYKVRKDPKTFEKYIPYFIVFGIHKDLLDDMIDYVDEKYPVDKK